MNLQSLLDNEQLMRKLKIVVPILIIIVVALSLNNLYATRNNGTLKLAVVPTDANVLVDNRSASAGDISLAPGNHTISVSRTDFTTQTHTVTIVTGQSNAQTIGLSPSDTAGANYLLANPSQESASDGVTSAEIAKNGQIITQNNPLVALLPYIGADFQVDAGVSQKTPDNRDAVAIYISADTPAGQTHALGWIKAKGFNPASYEIINQTFGGSTATPAVDNSGTIPNGD